MMTEFKQIETALHKMGYAVRFDFSANEVQVYRRPKPDAEPVDNYHDIEYCGNSIFDVLRQLADDRLLEQMGMEEAPLGMEHELSAELIQSIVDEDEI